MHNIPLINVHKIPQRMMIIYMCWRHDASFTREESILIQTNYLYFIQTLDFVSILVSQCTASDSVTDFSVLSNPGDTQNVSCMGISGRYNCPKSYA